MGFPLRKNHLISASGVVGEFGVKEKIHCFDFYTFLAPKE